jgi:hypothetical protein
MGKFEYTGGGAYTLNRQQGRAHYMSMVAGGSGITPCWQVTAAACVGPKRPQRKPLPCYPATPAPRAA